MEQYSSYAYEQSFRNYLNKVFAKMGLALFVTALTSFTIVYLLHNSVAFLDAFNNYFSVARIVLIIAQLGLCVSLSAAIHKMSVTTANLLFFAYAIITGITFSALPIYYGLGLTFTAFGFAAVLFICCAVIGKTTNIDLSKFSGLFIGGLITLVILSVAAFFIPFLRDSLLISYVGVLLFLGITAWDVQKLKYMFESTPDSETAEKLSVFGAFSLYLDFINIFLYVLRILGNRRRN